jgi:hypothetical protein
MSATMICAYMGCLLILAGIGMVVYQMYKVNWSAPARRYAEIGLRGIKLQTTYPGLIVIAIGAGMVIVGAVTSN